MKKILLLALISTILFGCKKSTQETTPTLNPITISITIGQETSNIVRVK